LRTDHVADIRIAAQRKHREVIDLIPAKSQTIGLVRLALGNRPTIPQYSLRKRDILVGWS
jgi:hypothetical protein